MKKDFLLSAFSKNVPSSTDRLSFRKMCKKDAPDMYAYACRAEVTQYLLWYEHPDIIYTKRYLTYVEGCYRAGSFFDFAVIERESGRMIGTCGFAKIDPLHDSAEIGYVLNPDFWNRGIATEAVCAVINYGFCVLGLHRIEARYMVKNLASRRVMEKCGMRFEGVHHDLMLIKGKYEDIGVYACIREEWDRRAGS